MWASQPPRCRLEVSSGGVLPRQGEVQALFLRHEGYLGAIGAFLKGAEQDSEWSSLCSLQGGAGPVRRGVGVRGHRGPGTGSLTFGERPRPPASPSLRVKSLRGRPSLCCRSSEGSVGGDTCGFTCYVIDPGLGREGLGG